jgi:hypothetical protein
MERFYTSIRGPDSSATAPSDLNTAQEPASNVEVSIAYSSRLGEMKGVEGSDAITELTELDGASSMHKSYSSPV